MILCVKYNQKIKKMLINIQKNINEINNEEKAKHNKQTQENIKAQTEMNNIIIKVNNEKKALLNKLYANYQIGIVELTKRTKIIEKTIKNAKNYIKYLNDTE